MERERLMERGRERKKDLATEYLIPTHPGKSAMPKIAVEEFLGPKTYQPRLVNSKRMIYLCFVNK